VARTSADYLVLDIETVPDTGRWTPAEGQEGSFPPSWAHRVIAIGCLWLDHRYALRDATVLRLGGDGRGDGRSDDAAERDLISAWSATVAEARPILVTYNGRRFDLPVLAMRALAHGVALGWYYRDAALRERDNEDRHLDLCDALADHGAVRSSSLDALAKLVGLPGKIGVDGSQVAELYARGEADAIASYCLGDLAQTALLFLRYRVLQGRVPIAAYRTAARALLDRLAADGRFAELLARVDVPRLLVA
jgi:hypothetical protein